MEVVQKETEAIVKIDASGYVFEFRFEAGAAWSARLLADRIRSRLGDLAKTTRHQAYEAGWKDAKSKRRKQDWFSGRLE